MWRAIGSIWRIARLTYGPLRYRIGLAFPHLEVEAMGGLSVGHSVVFLAVLALMLLTVGIPIGRILKRVGRTLGGRFYTLYPC